MKGCAAFCFLAWSATSAWANDNEVMLVQAPAAQPNSYDRLIVDAYSGFSARRFSNPGDDEGATKFVGIAAGVFVGARIASVTFGLVYQHDEMFWNHENGYPSLTERDRIDSVLLDAGWTWQHGRLKLTPHGSIGYSHAALPGSPYQKTLESVAGKIGIVADYYPVRAVSIGGAVDLDWSYEATPSQYNQNVSSVGITAALRLGFHLN